MFMIVMDFYALFLKLNVLISVFFHILDIPDLCSDRNVFHISNI